MHTSQALRGLRQTIARYIPDSRHFHSCAPTLAASLAAFSAAKSFKSTLSHLEAGASCLVMGYSAPSNLEALQNMLREFAVTDPAILIVDRLPIPDIYADMGLEVPDADFLQIDARTIGEELTGHSFDLIVQDFVLNCMPPAHWPALLQSTRALLKPEGLGLISLSTDAQPTVEPAQPIGKAFSLWPEKCADSSWSVSDLANSDEEYAQMSAHLAGKTLFNELTGHILQVTSPACSFEFFAPEYEINQMFRQAGLKVTPVHVSKAVDYSGLACTRHRLIVTLA